MGNVAKQTISTTFWASVEKIGLMGIQFVIGMILARMLAPSDYGVVALLMFFITIAQVFIDSGFGNALIRKQDCNNNDYSTAFFFNIVVGIVSYGLLFFFAPTIARFYDLELLIPVLRVYGLSLVFSSMTIVHNAILTHRLEFKAMARCSIISSLLSGGFAIGLAHYEWGVWALVFQTLSSALFSIVLLSLATRWKPALVFSHHSFSYLWSFGSRSLLSSLISALYSNIYSLVIGKYYTKDDLGFFNRGQNTAVLAPNLVINVFNKSSLPLLSKVQYDRDSLVALYRKFSLLVSFISFPLIFTLFSLAKPFILFVLTDKWADAIPYVQIFSISALTGAVDMINLNLLTALGRTDLTLKANLIKIPFGFLVVFGLLKTSPMILAIGCAVIEVICYLFRLYYANKVVDLKYTTQLYDLLPYLLASIASGGIAYLAISCLHPYLIQLVVGLLVFIISYIFFTYFIIKCPFYKDIVVLYKNSRAANN